MQQKTKQDADPLIRIRGLNLHYGTKKGAVQAVDNVDVSFRRGRTAVILGESGCGKSSLAKAILRLLPNNAVRFDGEVFLDGDDIMKFTDEEFRTQVRWTRASLVPQAAMDSLNPVIKVVDQIAEPLFVHGRARTKKEALERVREVFRIVGVPREFLNRYPFEFSGGMQQRAALAMALVTEPDMIVLDEPTSALDLLTQANIMNTLKKIKWELGMTFLLITHDISTSSELADDVCVMYAAWIIETGAAEDFFDNPLHPYSKMLMDSVPRLHDDREPRPIAGTPPPLLDLPQGCRFARRCPRRHGRCGSEPPMFETKNGRSVKCWLYEGQAS